MSRYDATIEAHTLNGYYVSYEGWGNREEVCFPKLFDTWFIFILQSLGVFDNTVFWVG